MNDEHTRETIPDLPISLVPTVASDEIAALRARITTIGAMCTAAKDALLSLEPEAALANIEAARVEAGRK